MNLTRYLFLALLLSLALGLTVSCEGPAGPTGQTGAEGPAGALSSLFCLGCHEPAVMDQKEVEFAEAGHSTAYTRFNRLPCAQCHSHEGFIEFGNGGQEQLEVAFEHGSTMKCGTCHAHKNNGGGAEFDTTAGWVPIRFNDPVVMRIGGDDIDFGNNSNLCVRCHQPRQGWELYDVDLTSDSVMVTSTRVGPHYGAQGTTLLGLGGDARLSSVVDITTIGPSTHGVSASCIKCHLHERNHTFKPNVVVCEACHTVSADFEYNGGKAEISEKMSTLAALLAEQTGQGIGQDTSGVYQIIPDSTVNGILYLDEGEYRIARGQFERKVFSALWNYRTVYYDQSGGVHNPAYVKALLDNAIAAMQ